MAPKIHCSHRTTRMCLWRRCECEYSQKWRKGVEARVRAGAAGAGAMDSRGRDRGRGMGLLDARSAPSAHRRHAHSPRRTTPILSLGSVPSPRNRHTQVHSCAAPCPNIPPEPMVGRFLGLVPGACPKLFSEQCPTHSVSPVPSCEAPSLTPPTALYLCSARVPVVGPVAPLFCPPPCTCGLAVQPLSYVSRVI